VFFSSPLWLLCLIPWAAVAIYMLIGRRRRVIVPLLDLWTSEATTPTARRRRRLPPQVAAILAGMFLAIAAAAGPEIRRAGTNRPVIFIVDRGITMSARQGSHRRFQALADDSAGAILHALGPGPASLVVIPGGAERAVDRADWNADVENLEPTAVDTLSLLEGAVRNALRQPDAIVVLLSDRVIDVNNDRLVRIVPRQRPSNIGIAALYVRAAPAPQAMVRIAADRRIVDATLHVSGAAPVRIAAAGNYFVDLDSVRDVVGASLAPSGDIDAADRAWAVRKNAWPALRASALAPAELQRMAAVYMADRPSGENSATVSIEPLNENLASDSPTAQIVTASTPTVSPPAGEVNWQADPVTTGVDWTAAGNDAQIAQVQPGPGWTRLVWIGDRTLVATRTDPARGIWVGFRSATWSSTPDFVIFWTKAFDWLGAGNDRYVSAVAGEAGAPLWPGLYRRDGRALAVNAPPVPTVLAEPTDWQSRLTSLAAVQTCTAADYSCWTLVAAIGCLLIAAVADGKASAA